MSLSYCAIRFIPFCTLAAHMRPKPGHLIFSSRATHFIPLQQTNASLTGSTALTPICDIRQHPITSCDSHSAAMGPSLRKRLSKRTSEATEVKSGSTTNTAPPLLAALNHLQQQPPTSTSKEDPNSTPPPPNHLMLPKTPDKAREPPSTSLLERYKERAPIAKAPVMPTPSEVLTMARSKIPAFSGDFDDIKKGLPLTPTPSRSEIPTATAPIKSTIRTVSGVDFQMVNAAQDSAELSLSRTSTAEPARAEVGGNENDSLQGQRRYLTRSQSKKEERSDSTVGDIGSETLKAHSDAAVIADDAGDVKIENEDKEAQPAESETPPARKVVKKKPSETSTPTKTKPKTSRFSRLSSSKSKKEDKPPSPTLPTPTSHTTETSNSSSSSSSSSVEFILESSTAQVGPAHNYQANSDAIEPLPTTRVILPVVAFPDQVLPGMLWASSLSATSRPALPWTWCKRWTCCRCAAGTIVEQSVCSKLACGHRRCGSRCVVSEGRRVASL